MVGKAAKPIPVMVLGVLLGRKSYPLKKYLFIVLIVIGVVLFMFKEQAKKGGDAQGFGIGEVLLLLSLTMDGLTGAVQVLFCLLIYYLWYNFSAFVTALVHTYTSNHAHVQTSSFRTGITDFAMTTMPRIANYLTNYSST